MLPSPSELTYFLELSQSLNMSRASERLGISQPSLSLAIKRLEKSVGTHTKNLSIPILEFNLQFIKLRNLSRANKRKIFWPKK